MDSVIVKYLLAHLNYLLALTFAENFSSIGLTEEAPDEFCGRAGVGARAGGRRAII